MAIKVGDRVPSAKLKMMTKDGIKDVSSEEIFGQGKVVMFAVPGAFTPTCSAKHLPGFVGKSEELKGKGVQKIVCMSVNDPFVMGAWGKDQNVGDKVMMVADGNGEFTKKMGLEMDASQHGLGTRSKRYALVAQDGIVKTLNVEDPGKFEVSSAEAMMKAL
jgi:peroxiredoxin